MCFGEYFGKFESGWCVCWYIVIFEVDMCVGRLFDLILLGVIFVSVLVVMFDSLLSVSGCVGMLFMVFEWFFMLLFMVEYVMCIFVVCRFWCYVFSFYGVIDFILILLMWLVIFVFELVYLFDVWLLCLLWIFWILKIMVYFEEV